MQISNESILLKELNYDATAGTFFVKSSGKEIVPNEEGFCWYYTDVPSGNSTKRRPIKIKANRLACLLAFGKAVRKDQRILHLNLLETDCRLRNLRVVPRKTYLIIQEARLNLDSRLRLVPHPSDQFSYFLCWKQDGRDKRELILDIVIAKQRLQKLQLKYSKILSKYCLFDEIV